MKNPLKQFSNNLRRNSQRFFDQNTRRFFQNNEGQIFKYLIAGNVLVYFTYSLNLLPRYFFERHFCLTAENRLHTYLTSNFFHSNLIELGFNMIPLYFFGQTIESIFGGRKLLFLYIMGKLFQKRWHNYKYPGDFFLKGCSGASSAILTFFIANFPNTTIILFIFPMPAWSVGALLMGYSYLNMNQSAHLTAQVGGGLFGLFYFLLKK